MRAYFLLMVVCCGCAEQEPKRSGDDTDRPTTVSTAASAVIELPSVEDVDGLIVDPPGPTPEGMVWVPGGQFVMGSEPPADYQRRNPHRLKPDESPRRRMAVDGFWMDTHEVTNRQFAAFVSETGYVTVAERPMDAEELKAQGVDVDRLPEGSLDPAALVFNKHIDPRVLRPGAPGWEMAAWQLIKGADWRHPFGPESTIEGRDDEPVVQVAYEDAVTYAAWAGKSLPTETEWEYAARGGLSEALYPWGNEREPDGEYRSNYFQGTFPADHRVLDGFEDLAPVGSFPANGYGLHDMAGNVWEWTADRYHHRAYDMRPLRNMPGPKTSLDPMEPQIAKRVTRGGSYLCNVNNCTGYRCAARMRSDELSAACHTGFRCVRRP